MYKSSAMELFCRSGISPGGVFGDRKRRGYHSELQGHRVNGKSRCEKKVFGKEKNRFEEDRTEKKERQSEASRREIPQKGPRGGGWAGRHGGVSA
ncbi:MAG: hypothetical protein V3V56_04805 [bacterium]